MSALSPNLVIRENPLATKQIVSLQQFSTHRQLQHPMAKSLYIFLLILLCFCSPFVRAQDILVADSMRAFVRNDTTFLDWRYQLWANEDGGFDTCIQAHFVVPKETPGLTNLVLRNMVSNRPSEWYNRDTLFNQWRQWIGLDKLPHNELGDFPREWFQVVYSQGKFYLSDDYPYWLSFEDSLLLFYCMENWMETFSDFRKIGVEEYAFNYHYIHGGMDTLKIEPATIKPVPGVEGLYLFHYGSDFNYPNVRLLTTREHLKDFDYVQSITPCYLDYLNTDAFPETKTPFLEVPGTIDDWKHCYDIIDYSKSITPAFAKIIQQSEDVLPIYQGKTSVKINGLWGVIDIEGNWLLPCIYVTPPHYDILGPSTSMLNEFQIQTWWVTLTPPDHYSDWHPLGDHHIALLKDSLWIIFDMGDLQAKDKPTFEDVRRAGAHHFAFKENGKWGIRDYHYKTIIPAVYDTNPISYNSLFIVEQNGKWGVVDSNNHPVIPLQYQEMGYMPGTLLAVKKEYWGGVNLQGDSVIPCIFESIVHIDDTTFIVKNTKGYGVLTLKGNYILSCQYNGIYSLGNRFYAVSNKRLKNGVVDSENQLVVPYKYDHIVSYSNNRFLVRLNNKYGFLDRQGKVVVPLKYDWAKPFSSGLAWVEKDDLWGLIDTMGREVYPSICHYPQEFSDGTTFVEDNGMYGIIDTAGKIILPFISHRPTDFVDGIAAIYDKDGNLTACADFNGIHPLPEPYNEYSRQGEFVIVERDGKYGVLNLKKRQLIIPILYDEVGLFSPEGFAGATLNGHFGFVDIHGNTTFKN